MAAVKDICFAYASATFIYDRLYQSIKSNTNIEDVFYMKYMFYILFIFSSIQSAIARNGNASNESERISLTPEQVVQIQLDAYNRRDIDAFLDTYADDVKMYNFPDKLTTSGKAEMKFSFSFFLPVTQVCMPKLLKK